MERISGITPIAAEEKQRPNKVVLSYAAADRQIAQRILVELQKRQAQAWFEEYELLPDDSITTLAERKLGAGDYLVVLLSPDSVNSLWVQQELSNGLSSDLTSRDITLLPVLVADCEIPLSLTTYQYFDLRTGLDSKIALFAEQLSAVYIIDFSTLDEVTFEKLVIDLLARFRFEGINGKKRFADKVIDLVAEYPRIDPFGIEQKENWLVEIKFLPRARADLRSITQLVAYLSVVPKGYKGLLVTNGQLTSVARGWLESAEVKSRTEVRVIDGPELKRLLLQHKDLINKYFIEQAAQRVNG